MEVKKYRKKPVEIEAIRFTRNNLDALKDFMDDAMGNFQVAKHPDAIAELEVKTLEDGITMKVTHIATEGDYIIKGIQGEFYACKPDIFEQTYEAVL